MGGLQMIFVVLMIAVLLGQIFLYKNKSSSGVYLYNVLLAIIIAVLNYSSLPQNYRTEQVIALALGTISILSIIPRFFKKDAVVLSNTMLSISVIGGVLYLFFGM